MNDLKIFSGTANQALARRITDYLGVPLGDVGLGKFPDGEISCKINEDIRGRDVFLIQPTCPPVNENIMQLLVMIDSALRASAERITAVIPYYGYARQDRKDEGRVPITAKLVANLITRAGANRVLTMDLHAAQIQGFFDVPVDHLYAAPVLNSIRRLTWRMRSSSARTKAASSVRSAMPSGSAAPSPSSTSAVPAQRQRCRRISWVGRSKAKSR
jgi:ribose-phosphate pyrophosphokinase